MKVVFENASIADAVVRASIVAPTRGAGFDKAAGIMLEVAADGTTTVSATDTYVYFRQWMRALEVDEPMQLLLPSKLIADALGALPIGSDKTVTLQVKPHGHGKRLLVSSGRLKAFINIMLAENYPRWSAFDPDCLTAVSPIGTALKAVEWATAKAGEEPFSGVHMAAGRAVATNRYLAAEMQCDLGDVPPTTIPAGEVAKLLKQSGEVRFGVQSGMMLFMPDDATQIMATTFDAQFPSLERAFHTEQPNYFTIFKQELLELLQKMNQFQSGGSRTPRLELRLDGSKLTVLSSSGDAGAIADEIDVEGVETHDMTTFYFAPEVLLPPISNAPGDRITVYYDPSVANANWRCTGDKGYQAWMKPLKVGEGM